ncbi:hypothetical protein ACFWJW_07365 [Streptomyces sp. NPDC127097]|uniref:hypothetical protein n=1 Tax=Streptomyces sp. NPDC127097 TaxID=3347136 RepID=UPI0036643D90
MRSRQLALCAAVAACAVTTAPAPAYGAEHRATGTATVQVTPASRGADTWRATGGTAGRALVRSGWAPGTHPASPATRAAHTTNAAKEAKATSNRELSSTSAVGLVLAGGAILVIAGQLLRLRLRLRRERRGDADER